MALPTWIRRRTPAEQEQFDRDSLLDEVAEWVGRSDEERALGLHQVIRLSDAVIASSPDGARMRAYQEPRAPADEALWLALVEGHRCRRSS